MQPGKFMSSADAVLSSLASRVEFPNFTLADESRVALISAIATVSFRVTHYLGDVIAKTRLGITGSQVALSLDRLRFDVLNLSSLVRRLKLVHGEEPPGSTTRQLGRCKLGTGTMPAATGSLLLSSFYRLSRCSRAGGTASATIALAAMR
jgi:hypothetical protein